MNSDRSRRHGNGSEDDAATRSARVESVFLSYAEPDDALVKKQSPSTLPLRVNQRQQSLPQQHQQPSRVAAALQSSNAARRPQQQHPPVPPLNLRNNSNLVNIPNATMPTSSSSLPPRSLQQQPPNQHMPVPPRSAGIPISPSMPSPSFLHQQQQHAQYMAQPHPQQRQIPGSASAPHLQDPRQPLHQPQHPSQLRQSPQSQSHAPPRNGPQGQPQSRPMHPQQGPQRPQIPIVQVTLPQSHATPPRYPQQHPHSPQYAQMKGSTSPRAVFAAPPSPSGSVEGSDETLVDSPHSARDGPKASFASPKAPAVAHPENDRLAPATPRLGGNKDFWKRFSTVVHQKEAREHNAQKLSGSASDSSMGEKPATRVPVSTGVSSEWLDQQQHKQKKWKIWVWLFAALIVAGIAGSLAYHFITKNVKENQVAASSSASASSAAVSRSSAAANSTPTLKASSIAAGITLDRRTADAVAATTTDNNYVTTSTPVQGRLFVPRVTFTPLPVPRLISDMATDIPQDEDDLLNVGPGRDAFIAASHALRAKRHRQRPPRAASDHHHNLAGRDIP